MNSGGGRESGPLGRFVAFAEDEAESPDAGTFLRGLTLGALLGAAIAGSAIWSRRSARRTGDEVSDRAPRDDGVP